MNLKQKEFVEHYLVTLNASKSAELAGYNKHTAGLLMQNQKVKNAITERMQEVDFTRIATLDEILARLTQIARGELFEEDDKKTRVANIIRACELLGKRYGAWEEAKNINIDKLTIINDIPSNLTYNESDCIDIDDYNIDDTTSLKTQK